MRQGAHHGLDHVARLGNAGGYWGFLLGCNGDADASGEYIGKGRVALMFIHDDKTTRVDQPFNTPQWRNTDEGWQHHGVLIGQGMGTLDVAILVQLLNRHAAILGGDGSGVADPADIAHPQFALQHAFGVADTV